MIANIYLEVFCFHKSVGKGLERREGQSWGGGVGGVKKVQFLHSDTHKNLLHLKKQRFTWVIVKIFNNIAPKLSSYQFLLGSLSLTFHKNDSVSMQTVHWSFEQINEVLKGLT